MKIEYLFFVKNQKPKKILFGRIFESSYSNMTPLFLLCLISAVFAGDDGGGACTEDFDCNDGECVQGTCDCDEKYAGEFCEDKRKSLLIAILLFIFLGLFGAGDFYTGYITIGIAKVVISGVVMLTPVIGWIFITCWSIACTIWNVVYIVQFAEGVRQDSDGYDLY